MTIRPLVLLVASLALTAWSHKPVDSQEAGNPEPRFADPELWPEYTDVYLIPQTFPMLHGDLKDIEETLYTLKGDRQCQPGRVVASILVGEFGRLLAVKFLPEAPGYDNPCSDLVAEALTKTEWDSGIVDGEPVKVAMSFPVTFR